MSIRLGPGLILELSNSNSNSNSNSSSNSTNSTLFARSSSNKSSSAKSEWEEEVPAGKSGKANARTRFATTRRVRRISPSGKSKSIGPGHRTRTRKHVGERVNVNATQSRDRYSAARLVAAAHKKSYTYDELKDFIDKARVSPAVRTLALQRIMRLYPNFGR